MKARTAPATRALEEEGIIERTKDIKNLLSTYYEGHSSAIHAIIRQDTENVAAFSVSPELHPREQLLIDAHGSVDFSPPAGRGEACSSRDAIHPGHREGVLLPIIIRRVLLNGHGRGDLGENRQEIKIT